MRSAPDQKEVGMLCKDELLLSYYFVLVLTTNIMTRIMKKELVVEFFIVHSNKIDEISNFAIICSIAC